ncbi:hypothetical protein [Sphingomonas faeni]|uniref:hypothetical protein n=1 Tax=Sphingomonas faeni TaxID=185950 RepID=UPI000D3BB91D|nr:hypothetical protein [Sphingomonas faeni]
MLDLVSSWVNHLLDETAYAEVISHGINADKLAANSRLDRFCVQYLNDVSDLSEEDARYDNTPMYVGA